MTDGADGPPLLVIRGDASAEEVAALVVALRATTASRAAPGTGHTPASQWSAPRRRLRGPHSPGPGAWRASALP